MANTKKNSSRRRRSSLRRYKKYGHRGGYFPLSPASFPSTQTATTASNNSTLGPPYNAMGPVSPNTSVGNFFSSGAIDQQNQNPGVVNSAYNGQRLAEMAGGSVGGVTTPLNPEMVKSMVGGGVQQGGVWNKMIGDAIAPLVILGLQQYYGPRNKSGMNKKMRKGKMTKRYRK